MHAYQHSVHHPAEVINGSNLNHNADRSVANLWCLSRLMDSLILQIYALNHLMRELEQQQFRQFCQLNRIGAEKTDDAVALDDESTQRLST